MHTDERTRSIVNGRLMEWNSHPRPLGVYIYTPPVASAIPSSPRPNRKIVAARHRCFLFMAPSFRYGRLNLIFFPLPPLFLLVSLLPRLYFPFAPLLVSEFVFLKRDFSAGFRSTRN